MKYSREQISKVVKNVFSKYDIDEDGFLDRDEVTLLMNETYRKLHKRELNQVEIEEFFSTYDRNKDNKIDSKEMVLCFTEYMQKL